MVVPLAAACALLSGALATAGDEPTDPISRLGQRSALQRWKDARSEWTGLGAARRERRQQMKQGEALENTFAPDAAAPAIALPAGPERNAILEPPATVDLSPVFTEQDTERPQFITPPRPAAGPAPFVLTPVPELPAPVASNPPAEIKVDDAPAAQSPAIESAPVLIPLPEPVAVTEPAAPAPMPMEPAPMPAAPAPLPSVEETPAFVAAPDIAPHQPTATAMLPQIPRTPISPTPTPAPPPTRIAPPPAPRLPDNPSPLDMPRSNLLVPPAPESVPLRRVAGPVELPKLKKITEIEPFKTCSMDGKGVKLCPPNTAGPDADRCPEQHPLPVFEGAERNFIDIEYCWDAPNLIHAPLYFEDVPLERYGHTYCEPLQSIASVSKFGLQLAGLPYQMAMAPIHKCEYPLGYYRPGDPAPYKCYQIPLNAEAALKAAYVYTGMSFITP